MSPSSSERQRRLAGIALAMKRGETPMDYSPEAAEMARSMSEKSLEEFAKKPIKKG